MKKVSSFHLLSSVLAIDSILERCKMEAKFSIFSITKFTYRHSSRGKLKTFETFPISMLKIIHKTHGLYFSISKAALS
jgi:hypothetical protein